MLIKMKIAISLAVIVVGLASGVTPHSHQEHARRTSACGQLAASFPNKTFVPGTTEYLLQSDSKCY